MLFRSGREFGIARTIILTDEGREHPLYRDKDVAFDALCSHEDEVARLPACGRPLARNAVSPIQAAELADGDRSFWGVQYHPEFTFGILAALLDRRAPQHLSEWRVADAEQLAAVAADFRALHVDPTRRDLIWRYGLTANVLDPMLRRREFRNWLETKVLPRVAARA